MTSKIKLLRRTRIRQPGPHRQCPRLNPWKSPTSGVEASGLVLKVRRGGTRRWSHGKGTTTRFSLYTPPPPALVDGTAGWGRDTGMGPRRVLPVSSEGISTRTPHTTGCGRSRSSGPPLHFSQDGYRSVLHNPLDGLFLPFLGRPLRRPFCPRSLSTPRP